MLSLLLRSYFINNEVEYNCIIYYRQALSRPNSQRDTDRTHYLFQYRTVHPIGQIASGWRTKTRYSSTKSTTSSTEIAGARKRVERGDDQRRGRRGTRRRP